MQIDAEILLKQLRQNRRRFGGLHQSPHQQMDTADATGTITAIRISLVSLYDLVKPQRSPQLLQYTLRKQVSETEKILA